jgi:hypothetical protein
MTFLILLPTKYFIFNPLTTVKTPFFLTKGRGEGNPFQDMNHNASLNKLVGTGHLPEISPSHSLYFLK